MSKIRVIVDSAGDLPLDVAEKNNILVVPIKFTFDGENVVKDKYEMSSAEFYKKERETGIIPKTMQISPADFEDVFRNEAKEYDELIVLTLGAKTSGTFNNANLAAQTVMEDTDVEICVIGSDTLSYSYGYVALKTAEKIADGASYEEATDYMKKMLAEVKTFFTVETLDYLKKGGRITTASAIIGGILDIRPIIEIKDGLTTAIDKVKGEKKAILRLAQLAKEVSEGKENAKAIVLNTDVPDKIAILKNMLEAQGLEVIDEGSVGPVIGCHSGPGAFGVSIVFE